MIWKKSSGGMPNALMSPFCTALDTLPMRASLYCPSSMWILATGICILLQCDQSRASDRVSSDHAGDRHDLKPACEGGHRATAITLGVKGAGASPQGCRTQATIRIPLEHGLEKVRRGVVLPQ